MSTFAERLQTLEAQMKSLEIEVQGLKAGSEQLSMNYAVMSAKLDEIQAITKKVEKFLNQLEGAGFVTRLLWTIFTTSGIIAFIKTILSK